MDFSAWFEVYPRRPLVRLRRRATTSPRIGRVLMARGRDATDVAIANTFGPADLVGFKVVSEELPEAA